MMSLGAVLVASVLGSVHCVGMCGVFAAMAVGGRAPVQTSLGYHLGRLLTYTTLGALAGGFGWSLARVLEALGPLRTYAPVIVAVVLIIGAGLLLFVTGEQALQPKSRLGRSLAWLQRSALRLGKAGGIGGGLALGASSTLLPCGWLWGFVLVAGSAGTSYGGALVMWVFWLGGLPALLSVGWAARHLSDRLRRVAPRLGALTLIIAALLSLTQKWDKLNARARMTPSAHAPLSVPQEPPAQGSETQETQGHHSCH
jgi:sulfite exporter TauE/SafE